MDISDLLDRDRNPKVEWTALPGTKVRIQFKQLLPKDLDRIAKRKDLYKRGRLHMKLYSEAILDECVLDWDNIFIGENEFPCTKQNKIILDGLMIQFRVLWKKHSGFVSENEDDEELEDEDELGN